jgi:hypothetical protein
MAKVKYVRCRGTMYAIHGTPHIFENPVHRSYYDVTYKCDRCGRIIEEKAYPGFFGGISTSVKCTEMIRVDT